MWRIPLILVALALASCAIPRWPAPGEVTSAYGLRLRGIVPEVHYGVDVSMPPGTEVRAMTRGRVKFAGEMNGYGLMIVLEHGGATETVYAHLSEIRARAGDTVGAHDVIGLSGQSGNASGPHLHFEVRRWGRVQDPVPLLGGLPPRD